MTQHGEQIPHELPSDDNREMYGGRTAYREWRDRVDEAAASYPPVEVDGTTPANVADAEDTGETGQLSLLDVDGSTPLQFRLSKGTRERGLRHLAEIRAQMEARTPSTGNRTRKIGGSAVAGSQDRPQGQ